MVLRLFRKRSSSSSFFSPSSSSLTTKTTLTYPRISTGNKLKSPHIERKYLKARSARQKSASTFGHRGLLILDSDDFVARDIANEVLGTGGAYAGNMTEVNSRGGYNNIDDASSMLSTFSSSSSSSIMTSKRHNDQITLKRITSSYRRDEERTTGLVKVRSLGIGSRRTESLRCLDPFTNTRMLASTVEEEMDECSI